MRTEGQVLLLKLANRLSEVRIARKCGVGQPTISLWISGKRKPNFESRKTLLEQCQIPMEAWDRRVEES
jgi:transcriptional regulator with XRE-family HTH domain